MSMTTYDFLGLARDYPLNGGRIDRLGVREMCENY